MYVFKNKTKNCGFLKKQVMNDDTILAYKPKSRLSSGPSIKYMQTKNSYNEK